VSSTSALLIQLLGAGGGGAVLVKAGDYLIGRQRNSADAAEVNTRTAQALLAEVDKRRREDREEYERDLALLRGKVGALERKDRTRDILADRHSAWDREVAGLLRDLGQSVAEPPPLFVPPAEYWPTRGST
jgi:hypothetical protein